MKAPDRPSSKLRQAPAAPKLELNVKLYFQQNWRRDVRVFQTDNRSEYRKFLKSIKSVLKLRDNTHIVLKWQDSTGDLITISTDLEMQLATKNIRTTETLNICVQLLEEVSVPTLCDKCDQTIICNIRYKCDACANFVCCVRCYQAANPKTSIHEHELYKEKFPCYCPMHRVSESDVPRPLHEQRPHSAIPHRMLRRLAAGDRNRSNSTNSMNGAGGFVHPGTHGGLDDRDVLFSPTAPPYECDPLPTEHNYRTSERSEVVRGPHGDVYRQQETAVIESPNSGVVAIRSRRSRETRTKGHQLG